MNNFARESKDRTRSERLIDRHLLSSSSDPGPSKKLKLEENKARPNPISFDQGFEKLKRHLQNPSSLSKSLKILMNFLETYSHKIPKEQVFLCLNLIFTHDFATIFPILILPDIFNKIKDLDIDFEENHNKTFQIWDFLSKTFNLMHTDDSVLFHKLLRQIDEKLETLESANEESQLYARGIISLKAYLKKPWSRASFLGLVRKCYRKIDIFPLQAKDEILKMLDSNERSEAKQQVPEILKGKVEPKDNRSYIEIGDSLNKWADKQNGMISKDKII